MKRTAFFLSALFALLSTTNSVSFADDKPKTTSKKVAAKKETHIASKKEEIKKKIEKKIEQKIEQKVDKKVNEKIHEKIKERIEGKATK